MPTPYQHQIDGALFLARGGILLADEQRVGKTGSAILACDFVLARKILVITTASARPNWAREFREWQALPRSADEVVVVGWSEVAGEELREALCKTAWDVIILDESHYAKNPAAKRTQAVYGTIYDLGVVNFGKRVWCLSGTPQANSPADLWPMLAALDPARIKGVRAYSDFVARFCVVQRRNINGRMIEVVKGGKNLDELRERLAGFWLRRTQQDVGIREPIFSVFSVVGSFPADASLDEAAVLEAAENGDTASLEMHLGTIRRVTGAIKARSVAAAVTEELEDGLPNVVLMCWHKDTMAVLAERLSKFGAVRLDGSCTPAQRERALAAFQDGRARVFIGQILAAGEAVDLSASADLIFVEPSFVPKDMAQAALRITNHAQKRQPLVRVAALAGSIDEPIMGALTRKVSSIRKVMQ